MKKILLLALILAAPLAAEDLVLINGVVYEDWRFISQSPTSITIRYRQGGAKVEKKYLPPALLARYPVDEAGAKIEAARLEQLAQITAAQKAEVQRRDDARAGKPTAQDMTGPVYFEITALKITARRTLETVGPFRTESFAVRVLNPLGTRRRIIVALHYVGAGGELLGRLRAPEVEIGPGEITVEGVGSVDNRLLRGEHELKAVITLADVPAAAPSQPAVIVVDP